MNFRKGRGREDLEINLIPFIDVLLVIVIFLMVTTTYSKFTALQITLPTADVEKPCSNRLKSMSRWMPRGVTPSTMCRSPRMMPPGWSMI